MFQSRVISALLCIVGLNAGLVVWSVVDRHSLASAQTASETPTLSKDQQLLESIPMPEPHQLSVPSMPADIESDVGFQKFREEAAKFVPLLDNSLLVEPEATQSESTKPPAESLITRDDFMQIERRLQAVLHLNEAAISLTREAQQLATSGHAQRASELLKKTDQLRQMAAELLVAPDISP